MLHLGMLSECHTATKVNTKDIRIGSQRQPLMGLMITQHTGQPRCPKSRMAIKHGCRRTRLETHFYTQVSKLHWTRRCYSINRVADPYIGLPTSAWNAYLKATGATYSEQRGTFGDGLPAFVTEAQFAKMQPLHLKLANNKTFTITRDAQILPRSFTASTEFGGTPGRIYLAVFGAYPVRVKYEVSDN